MPDLADAIALVLVRSSRVVPLCALWYGVPSRRTVVYGPALDYIRSRPLRLEFLGSLDSL